jgi:hypothetical protein
MKRREFITLLGGGGGGRMVACGARAASCENPDASAPRARWVLRF